jgi:glutaredoxin 3
MKHFKIICWTECPYCIRAKNLLIEKGEQFEYCSIDQSAELLAHYKTIYNHNTVPIIVMKEDGLNDKLIGGYTELIKFYEQGPSGDNL